MTSWFRTWIKGDEDRRQYFEADGEGYPLREVEVRTAGSVPVTAASAAELGHLSVGLSGGASTGCQGVSRQGASNRGAGSVEAFTAMNKRSPAVPFLQP